MGTWCTNPRLDRHALDAPLWQRRAGGKESAEHACMEEDYKQLPLPLPLEVCSEIKNIMKLSLNAVQAGAATLHEINQKRRDNLKPDLNLEFQSLCNPPEKESGEALFGPNFSDSVAQIKQAQTIGLSSWW